MDSFAHCVLNSCSFLKKQVDEASGQGSACVVSVAGKQAGLELLKKPQVLVHNCDFDLSAWKLASDMTAIDYAVAQ